MVVATIYVRCGSNRVGRYFRRRSRPKHAKAQQTLPDSLKQRGCTKPRLMRKRRGLEHRKIGDSTTSKLMEPGLTRKRRFSEITPRERPSVNDKHQTDSLILLNHIVILIRNLRTKDKLTNRTRLLVKSIFRTPWHEVEATAPFMAPEQPGKSTPLDIRKAYIHPHDRSIRIPCADIFHHLIRFCIRVTIT